jgi:hypothetical protein
MNLLAKGFLILGMLFLSSCASYIHTEKRPIEMPGDISTGLSYQWSNFDLSLMAPKEKISTTFSEEIKREISSSLTALGYKEVQNEPDFYIDAVLTLAREESQRIETNAFYDQEDYLKYGLRWRLAPDKSIVKPDRASPNIEIAYYQKGTLHIGAFEPSGAIAWHGEAHKIIETSHSPDEHRAVLSEAARQLMLKFPPATEKES